MLPMIPKSAKEMRVPHNTNSAVWIFSSMGKSRDFRFPESISSILTKSAVENYLSQNKDVISKFSNIVELFLWIPLLISSNSDLENWFGNLLKLDIVKCHDSSFRTIRKRKKKKIEKKNRKRKKKKEKKCVI